MTSGNPTETPIFSAVLRPHRSLSPRGFVMVMLALISCSFTAGLAFWSMGAWPVVGFFGLDIVLVQLAFRLNYRQARASEEITVFADRMTVVKTTPRGDMSELGFNPYWARIEVDRHPRGRRDAGDHRLPWQAARYRRFPRPARARESFAAALSAALAEARATPASG